MKAEEVSTHTPAPSVAAAEDFPVSYADRFFLIFEKLHPPTTAIWAFEVEGEPELSRERFISCLQTALSRHPKGAARLESRPGRPGLVWAPQPGLARQMCHFHEPLNLLADAENYDDFLAARMNAPMNPRTGPLLEFHWVPQPDGRALWLFRFHHALSDGFGSLFFMRDLLMLYNGCSPEALPESAVEPPPLVEGSFLSKMALLGRLTWFQLRRALFSRLAPPAKLFDTRKTRIAEIDLARLNLEASELQRYLDAARSLDTSFNVLLVAAQSIAIERWRAESGDSLGTLRLLINENLRDPRKPYPALENRSSAFPLWIRPRDRLDLRSLTKLIDRQVAECRQKRISTGVLLSGSILRLPLSWTRALLLPAATRPKLCDSMIVSNLGRLPDSDSQQGWFHLGPGRFTRLHALVRPAEGVGVLGLAATLGSSFSLTICFFRGYLARNEVQRLLTLIRQALDEISDLSG